VPTPQLFNVGTEADPTRFSSYEAIELPSMSTDVSDSL
jgi:hypothetical protein